MPPVRNTRPRIQQDPRARLTYSLVLNRYILSLFGCISMDDMSKLLRDPALEGWDENNVSFFYHEMISRLFHFEAGQSSYLDKDTLLKYDANIFRHTKQISEGREPKIRWKYFQYLSLLFTEIYLDRYFSDKEALLEDLNRFLTDVFNQDDKTYHGIEEFTAADLNKIAFWSATGSGKTLIMNVNILQYRHYAKVYGRKINRVLLLTPNEGLTKQHLEELALSKIEAHVFSKSAGSMFNESYVELLEISKLAEKNGDKTVAVDSFEGDNLVLVDEGHKGASGEVWKPFREKLAEGGFSFEYSATFGQSISAADNVRKKKLLDEYGKATIFDYSYRYFYLDGYGKDYQILNLNDQWNEDTVYMYLSACLLSFYEQTTLYQHNVKGLIDFMIEKPLAIFVGGSVTAVRTEGGRRVSDVVQILQFFESFVGNKAQSVTAISLLMNGTDGLVDQNNRSIFSRSFTYLRKLKLSAEDIYANILAEVFNSTLAGAKLHLDNLKGQDGEIGMRVGNADYFGVINVGDDSKLLELCAENGILTMAKDYSGKSLFRDINRPGSKLNILIGSKKFTEGWSSWRVSTMGLMNIGKSEGSEIIQMFGRGVRLKGYKHSLKRSSALDPSIEPQSKPEKITLLETLNIFGIRADYMEQFKQYLLNEGLPTNDSDYEEITLPVMPVVDLKGKRLKYIRVKEGKDFKKETAVTLDRLDERVKVTLDYYPKIQMLKSRKRADDSLADSLDISKFTAAHLSIIDWNKVYFDLVQFKNERNWYNMTISADQLRAIAHNSSWYTLKIPAAQLEFTDYGKCRSLWQEVVTTLLKMYVDKAYNISKGRWMSENVETAYLEESDPNFDSELQILIHRHCETIIDKVKELSQLLEDKTFRSNFRIDKNFEAIFFSQHLYQPLMYINQPSYKNEAGELMVEVRPVALNVGEKRFVEDLKKYYTDNPSSFDGVELYLLRNKSRKGIGFFEANNFYPDFILWIIKGEQQYVTFVDPKGIRNIQGFGDPKIALHKLIREEIEPRLNDENIILNSFIISNTEHRLVEFWDKEESEIEHFNAHHIYFQNEQENSYIKMMLGKIVESEKR